MHEYELELEGKVWGEFQCWGVLVALAVASGLGMLMSRERVVAQVSCLIAMYVVGLGPGLISTGLGSRYRHGPPLLTAARYGYFPTVMGWAGVATIASWFASRGKVRKLYLMPACVLAIAYLAPGWKEVEAGAKAFTSDYEFHLCAIGGEGVSLRTSSMSGQGKINGYMRGRVPDIGEESRKVASWMEETAVSEEKEAR